MNRIELGKDGLLIEWREHMLSGLMRELGEEELAREPALHPVGSWDARRLTGITIDQEGMRWNWEAWEKVAIAAFNRERKIAEASRTAAERGFISWDAILSAGDGLQGAYFDSLELTPWDRLNDRGVTVRIERPAVADTGAASFRFYQPGRHSKIVRVRLEKSDPHWREVGVWSLQYGGDGYVTKGDPLQFNREGWVDAPVRDFRGALAVVAVTETNEPRLLACRWFADWDDSLSAIIDEGTAKEVRAHVEGGSDLMESNEPLELTAWLGRWPHRSRARLRQAYRKSLSHSSLSPWAVWQLIEQNPTGLHRAVMLRSAGLLQEKALDRLAEDLKGDDFLRALQRMLPILPDRFSWESPAGQRWMIAHVDDENFLSLIELAGDGALEQLSNLERPLDAPRQAAGTLILKSTSGIHTAASETGRVDVLEAPDDLKLDAESRQDWITIENVATRTVFYSVAEHTGNDWRVGEINVNGAPFQVIQKGAEP